MRQQPTRWHALGLSLLGMALALLAACGAAGASGGTVSYHTGAGQIVVQVFPQPGNIFPGVNAVPSWTLYGDGTLVYKTGGVAPGSSQLMTAKLSPSEVNSVLNVIVNQDRFFASSKQSYGDLTPDTGSTHLTVNANGQSKTVILYADPGSSADTETRNVFAVERYLADYQPANPQPYVTRGAALLVPTRSAPGGAGGAPAPIQWPYADVNLGQAYALSCGYVGHDAGCTGPSGARAQLMGVYGSRGNDILALSPSHLLNAQQGAYVYSVSVFPLLPDALVSQNGQAPGVLINASDRLRLQPAPPANG